MYIPKDGTEKPQLVDPVWKFALLLVLTFVILALPPIYFVVQWIIVGVLNPQWGKVMDWRVLIFAHETLPYVMFGVIALVSALFFFKVRPRYPWIFLGIVAQIMMLWGVMKFWESDLLNMHFYVVDSVEIDGTDYHLVQPRRYTSRWLELYVCEEGRCQGLYIVFIVCDSLCWVGDAMLTVDDNQLLVSRDIIGEIRIDPDELPDFEMVVIDPWQVTNDD